MSNGLQRNRCVRDQLLVSTPAPGSPLPVLDLGPFRHPSNPPRNRQSVIQPMKTIKTSIASRIRSYHGAGFRFATLASVGLLVWTFNDPAFAVPPSFSDADWVSLNPTLPGGNGDIEAVAVDAKGNLYVGGLFTFIGTNSANRVARWDGKTWSPLGSGMNSDVYALAVSGTDLYAGGKFTEAGGVPAFRIAKWNGSTWLPLGSGVNGLVRALAVSGNNLYAGGTFTTAGDAQANRIAKWDGSSWSALGTGVNGWVRALAIQGTDVYAGGTFTTAGDLPANRIARWDGSSWSTLGSGMNAWVRALVTRGTDLYASGTFTTAGGVPANRVARWDGTAWSPLGSGLNGMADALATSATDLYAGGTFTTAAEVPANRVAKWDGTTWSPLGSGISGAVLGLALDGAGHLFVGGNFSRAGTNVSPFIAQANVGVSALARVVQCMPQGNGAVTLNCLGMAGYAYDVQRATDIYFTQNLTTLLTTNAPAPDGLFRYTDSNPPGQAAYYRLRQR